jgi:hypothetical protein
MSFRRILLFSILFLILALSSLYYTMMQGQRPLRVDPVPADAYVVPWMQPYPSIRELNLNGQQPYGPPTFDINSVMSNALKINMTFRISTPGGMRVVPSTLYLGHDSDYLYVGGEFRGIGMNPASNAEQTLPDCLEMFFDVTGSGVLRQPESGFRFSAYVLPQWNGMWIYHDQLWANYVNEYGRASWLPADYYYDCYIGKPQTVWSDGGGIKGYENSTETLTIILSKFLSCPGNSEVNALQMRPGERWVMGFLTQVGFITDTGEFEDLVDGWPTNIYPYLSNDSSWWPKMVIDLANPPSTISGQTASRT